jgi:hypothetical protein
MNGALGDDEDGSGTFAGFGVVFARAMAASLAVPVLANFFGGFAAEVAGGLVPLVRNAPLLPTGSTVTLLDVIVRGE